MEDPNEKLRAALQQAHGVLLESMGTDLVRELRRLARVTTDNYASVTMTVAANEIEALRARVPNPLR